MNKKSAIMSLPLSLLFFILGFIILFSNNSTLNSLNSIVSTTFLLISIIQIFSFFYIEEYNQNRFSNLLLGLINLWMAIFTLNHYGIFTSFIPSFISLYVILYGIEFFKQYCQKKEKNQLIFAVISFLLTTVLLVTPLPMLATKLSGLSLIIISFYLFIPTSILIMEKPNNKK
ncbi:MAG: DUF308 domain-containing protein [Bacilli bacterium]|nr:DUF308 domain-containing protein [Bacilli bacterium]